MSGSDHALVAELRGKLAEQERRILALEAHNADLLSYANAISHDLKSPLVTVLGFLSFLRRDAAAGDLERMDHDISRITLAVERVQKLLDEQRPRDVP